METKKKINTNFQKESKVENNNNINQLELNNKKNVEQLTIVPLTTNFNTGTFNEVSLIKKLPQIYVINLERSKHRWANITRQFSNQNVLDHLSRIEGVDGKKLAQNLGGDAALSSELKQYLHPMTIQTCNTRMRTHHDQHSFNSLGCYIAHMKAWKEIIDSGQPYGVVMEDDVNIEKNFIPKLNTYLENAPVGWDILVICPIISLSRAYEFKDLSGIKWKRLPWILLSGYVITVECAKKLLKEAIPIQYQVDWFLAYKSHTNYFWIAESPLVRHGSLGSEISHTPVVSEDIQKSAIEELKKNTNIFGTHSSSIPIPKQKTNPSAWVPAVAITATLVGAAVVGGVAAAVGTLAPKMMKSSVVDKTNRK